ncbi:MAG: 16S rRNA (adenine(1518)-N(6)/adenine(1519)-N(6))-dimethyltransferase RsmA [Betaproteobacteria bacterium]|nr:16S rRNA (adenine(1518)-N(6)/adenine(1519)-N(6))-dimethyltransferase RsmA [Betaproteobacteria bacterium]
MKRSRIVPRKRFGQHFLHERGVIERIVQSINPQPGDVIVEVGAGEGALTRALLERVAKIEAIEIDRDLAARLAAEFSPSQLVVHVADVLEFDFSLFPEGVRIVGNLPYNISTPMLFHLARYATRVRDMHFMLQLEVVERMVAKPSTPEYGRLSVMLQTRFRMDKLFRVGPGAFRPPPKVQSAVVRLVPLAHEQLAAMDHSVFEAVVRSAFSARRKTLRNALAEWFDEGQLRALGIDPRLRPENLSPNDFVHLAEHVGRRGSCGSDPNQ